MTWICRSGADGGISGTDDFSNIDADFQPIELSSLQKIVEKYNSTILEVSADRVRIAPVADVNISSLEKDLKSNDFAFVNRSPFSGFLDSGNPSYAGKTHWHNYSSLWDLIKPPLRPCEEDIQFVEQTVQHHFTAPVEALLLGVTQEYSKRKWVFPISITSIDNEPKTIRRVWPKGPERNKVIQGDWLEMPFAEGRFDIAIGDGSLNCLVFPTQYQRISERLAKVLKKNALLMVRVYSSPHLVESIEDILKDIANITNFHCFKWRLAMVVQGCARAVVLHDIWTAYKYIFSDHESLSKITGWPIEIISTIDSYKDNRVEYSFPKVFETVEALSEYFRLMDIRIATYELAERCPMLIFKRL